jgi:hypothetical protein
MIFIVFVVVRALDDYFCNNQHQDEPEGENYDCHLTSYNMLLAALVSRFARGAVLSWQSACVAAGP